MIKKLLFFIVITSLSCQQKIDRQKKLDEDYPSINFSSFEQTKHAMLGAWLGRRSLLTEDSVEGEFLIHIKYDFDDHLTIYEYNFIKDRQKKHKIIDRVMLYSRYDDNEYVIENEQRVLELRHLSEKQLMFNKLLFEKVGVSP